MGSAIAPDKKPLPICSSTLKCSITAGVVIPRWAPDLRFSSCTTGSSLATKPDRRHKSYRLEGEKQREAQTGQVKISGRLQIDDQCELSRPLNGKVPRLKLAQDLPH